jgi:DNA gyrase subunit A
MGVSFVKFKGDDRVVTIARNAELPGADTAEGEPAEGDTAAAEAVDAVQPGDAAAEATDVTDEAPEE